MAFKFYRSCYVKERLSPYNLCLQFNLFPFWAPQVALMQPISRYFSVSNRLFFRIRFLSSRKNQVPHLVLIPKWGIYLIVHQINYVSDNLMRLSLYIAC